jgi:hypothetical protein
VNSKLVCFFLYRALKLYIVVLFSLILGAAFMKIKKKILTDENNEPVAVQIDYEDWLKFEKILEKSIEQEDISEFSGKINLKEDPLEFQKKIRDEWN